MSARATLLVGRVRAANGPGPRPLLRRAVAMLVSILAAVCLIVAGPVVGASADQPRRSIAQGITAAGGLLVDPAGRVWVSDAVQGFCRLTEATATAPGAIDAGTCLGGTAGAPQAGPRKPGAPALLDPTPNAAGNGDELALVPDAAPNSSNVVRARWDALSARFRYASTLTLIGGDLRPVGVTVGPDHSAYVVFERARSVLRVVDPAATQPTVETVAFLRANGARAIAAGVADSSGRVTVYVAEASGLTSFLAPLTGRSGGATSASYPVGAVARLHFDAATRTLYAGTAAATSAGGDTIARVDTKTGQVESNWAVGFTRVGGIVLRNSLALVADDPGLLTTPVQTGKGAVYLLGEVLPRITAGPTMADGTPAPDPAITNDTTPTFRVAVDGAAPLECAFDHAWKSCAPGDVTAPSPLADGSHHFAVRIGTTGTPVERVFTVDTTPPPAPKIVTPAPGSTVGMSVTLGVTAEAGATLRCAVDAAPPPGTSCSSGQTFTFTTAGEHSIRVTATDAVGNVSAASTSTFTVDVSVPVPEITAPPSDGQTLTGTATFEFSAGTGTGLTYRCRVDAQPFEACTSPRSYTGLSAGTHAFTVEARNAVGNTGTATRSFLFVVPDTTPPVVTATPAGGTYGAGQQITLTADEDATIYVTVDGSAPTTASPRYTVPIVLSTDFTLRYFGVDTAGNASVPASQSYVVRKPSNQPHDYNGDGKVDLVALDGSGDIRLFPGNGTGVFQDSSVMATGAQSVNALITPGDFTGDGHPDLLARTRDGTLRLYRGNSDGALAEPETIATGWGGLSMPFSPGDWDGDGKRDLMARNSSGLLLLYPGNGAGGLLPARTVGSGWTVMTAILGPGDWNGDHKPDVMARDGSGRLLLYPGNGTGGWLTTKQIGSGWTAMTAIVGPGDCNSDGKPDIVARDGSGRLLLYPGNGTGGWLTTKQIGSGWNGMTVIS